MDYGSGMMDPHKGRISCRVADPGPHRKEDQCNEMKIKELTHSLH